MPDINALSEEQIRVRLAARQADPYINPFHEALVPGAARPAAVLLPLFRHQDAWHLLLIRRTHVDGDHHSGQVAFPGGRLNPDDASTEATALRETEEEIGLPPARVTILGELEDMVTISNYRVTPLVGVIPWPFPLAPAEEEVARIFSIPLAWLADSANREVRQREIPRQNGSLDVVFFSEYDGELLWGVSARITLHFLEALGLA